MARTSCIWLASLLGLFVLVLQAKAYLVNSLDERPRIVVDDGDLLLVAAQGKDVRFQVLEGGHVYLNNEDLVQLVQTLRQNADLLEDSQGGTLSSLQRTVTKLNNAVFGKGGLGQRLALVEQGSVNSSTGTQSTGSLETRIRNLETKVTSVRKILLALKNKLKANECSSNPCRNGGTCEDSYDSFICRCPPNWEGTLCDTDVNECSRFAGTDLGCQNGATCINKPGTYECLCASGYFGIHCTQTSNACSGLTSHNLCGHGMCISQPNTPLGYTCMCDQGWTKDPLTQACTLDVDECASKHPSCSRSPFVSCINVPGSFYCGACPQGYTGNGYYCADIDECQVNNGGCSTNPTVQCINTQGSRMCGICPPGYQGDGVTCTYRGVCQINNGGCHHLARCVENPGLGTNYAQCICPMGYVGSGVGQGGCVPSTAVGPVGNPCASNPCVHGTCSVVGSGFVCSCVLGYTGATCSIGVNPCSPNPCKNGGTCVAAQGSYHCRCLSNSTGTLCEHAQSSCGGYLLSEEGSLRFPAAGTVDTYPHNLSCAWVIITNSSLILNVTFASFDVEESPECFYDWLQIHDGRNSGDQLIDRFCGNKLPRNGTILSTHNSLYLWFRSDHSVSKDGFSLSWKSIRPVCGGHVRFNSHGSISSPGYPGKYPKNRDCLWVLTAPLSRRIQFHFILVKLENHVNCSYDFVEIRDGFRESDPVLQMLCNTTDAPAPVSTSGPEALIRFHSDGEGNDAGFLISYSSVAGVSGCGGALTGSSGTIVCPTNRGYYTSHLNCEWQIQVPLGYRIRISFSSFHLESSANCRYDKLEVHEGPHPTSPLVGRYCGSSTPRPYTSQGNYLTIIFTSDWSGSGEGFTIQYEEICGGIYGEPTGVITSPNYPSDYPISKICTYEIGQPLGKAITLEFQDFQLESNWRCLYDYLEIHNGHDASAPLVGTYCSDKPPIVISDSNYLWLKFRSDFSRSRKGFYANYTTQDVGCGGIAKNLTGVIESPHYPNLYRHNQVCRWIIVADVGHVIQLQWQNFELESSYSCAFDFVEVFDNSSAGEGNMVGRYCGTTKPPDMTSVNNIVTLVFRTDSSRVSTGFQVVYSQVDSSQVCDGTFVSPTGVIRSPEYPNKYPNGKQCTWILRARSGQQIRLNVTDFELESTYNCRFDYLEIRNGGSASSPLIGKYCGTTIPREIDSMSNQLYLHFKSDFSLGRKGFQIYWDGTSQGCGGTLTAAHGSVRSPNYPQPYDGDSECFWRISTSHGSVIQVVFVDIQLESTHSCYFDYVAVYDGVDANAKLLGKYCEMGNNMVILSTTNHIYIKFRSDSSNQGNGFSLNYATKCTTDITGYQGVIESPNFPDTYPSRLDCMWNINVPKGNKVNITFTHFHLERKPCQFDYLQVTEALAGESYSTPLTEKLCGSSLPPPIHSSMNKVQVTMKTDMTIGFSGFRLEWLLDGCGGILTKSDGEFTSPGYPNGYKEDSECHWTIKVSPSQRVQLTIEELVIEGRANCTFDSVTIYGGPDTTSPKLHPPLCHTLSQPLVTTSSGNNMLVIFKSDFSYTGKGFKATYEAVAGGCGGTYTAPHGSIHSPNYPLNYNPFDDCSYLITVDPNHVVQLTFTDFEMELSRNCTWDYVKVFDGNSTESPVMATLCGSNMPNITTYRSTSNTMFVRMKADGSNSLKGFAATYTTACGARIIAEDYGIIDLSRSVNVNPENENCSWIISAARPEDHVTLTITHMDLSPSFENSHESCEFAYVEVRDGNDKDAPLKGRYCGSRAPPQISSIGSTLFVRIVTMYGAHFGHFSASYSVYSGACGGKLTSEHGAFASPGYPASYPLNSECVWTITSSPGNRVLVVFRSFALEESPSCNKDYVEMRENNGAGRVIGIYCSELPTNITAARTVWVKFHSDEAETAAGFIADYSLLHGSDLSGPSGEIASPLFPRPYIQEGDFSWRVTVTFGKAVSITFSDFFIERYMNSCEDLYLAIYEGYDNTGVEIFRGCGFVLPEPVVSYSNMVYIVMHTMAYYHGSYFKLRWLEVEREDTSTSVTYRPSTTPGCTERFYLTDGNFDSSNSSQVIQSPGYPNGYPPNQNCEWIFETPPLSHVVFDVLAMDLEEGYGGHCYFDYVSVYEGVGGAEDWKLLKTLCLTNATAEPPITATNLMKVQFHSDSSNNKTGFSARVSSMCGGAITASDGVIELVNITRYVVECQWNVTVRPGRTISVTFDRFEVYADRSGTCSTTYIMLRNGLSEQSPVIGLGKYCAASRPGVITTTGNHLFIKYRDVGSGSPGFKLRFTEVSVTCGGRYTLTKRNNMVNISSPNFPNMPYPHSECTWIIMAPGGERLQVDFDDRFNFYKSDCVLEYVELRDGGAHTSPLIGRFCREAPDTQSTTGNVLFVRYFTDVDSPHTGFKANISIARCGGTIRGLLGEIQSPNYPNQYPANIECVWRIVGRINHVLEMQFKDIDFHQQDLSCNNSDSLTITEVVPYNNTARVVKTLCGSSPEPNIQLAGNEALVKLKTMPKIYTFMSDRGFHLNFSSAYDHCGGELTAPEGQIQSPGYPNGFPHYRYCEWTITVPKGRRVTVNIVDLDMDFRTGSNILFFNNDFCCFILSLKTNSSVRQIESSSSRMKVYYYSQTGASHRGFRATYTSTQPEACGGDLVLNSGALSLSSTITGRQSLYCEWRRVIPAPNNETFALIITQATVGYANNMQCTYQGTKFKAYAGDDTVQLAELCRNITQEPLFILSPFATTTFVASQVARHGPLNITAHYQTSACGGVLTGSPQTITSPGFPNNYDSNLHCAWAITFADGEAISVRFVSLNLESNCAHDYVAVYNGQSRIAPKLGHYCGSTVPPEFTTHSNELWLEFHSDGAIQSQGFKVVLTGVTAGCGGIMHSNTGTANTPNFPNAYPNSGECEWDIRVENGYIIQLEFTERFKLEDSPGCANDFVELFDFQGDDYVSRGKYCGPNTPPVFNSTSSRLKVLFRSNDRINADGFKIEWKVHCGGIIDNVLNGTLTSPGFPGTYSNNLFCNYTILMPTKFIRVYFQFFHLEKAFLGCTYDNVTIYTTQMWNSEMRKVGTYCGVRPPPDITSKDKLSLIFQTDGWGRFDGFLMRFEALGCGGDITTPGSIFLPRANIERYYTEVECLWNITAPANQVVVARFSVLETHAYGSCYEFNSVNIYNGTSVSESNRLARYCGNLTGSPPVISSNTNNMIIHYSAMSYDSTNSLAAKIYFTYGENVGCGGTVSVTTTAKTLSSPDIDRDGKYEAALDCHWLIRATENQVVTVQFTSFEVQPCVNVSSNSSNYCSCDFLEIYDGPSHYSRLIGKYCGSEIPRAIISSTNHLWVRFVSDAERNGRGFVASFSAQNSICGPARLNVTNTPQILTSPNYPANYPTNIRCTWLLENARSYETVEIHIEDVDIQGGGDMCSEAHLFIADNEVSPYISEGLGQNFVYAEKKAATYRISYAYQYPLGSSTFCGKPLSHNYYSSSSAMVALVTGSVPSKGFKLQYSTAGCNRNYTGVQGRIRLNQMPADCVMLIETTANKTISLYTGEVYLTHSDNCNEIGMEIFDGASDTSRSLGRFCGQVSFRAIFSSGPVVRIHLWMTSGWGYTNLDMTYTTTDQGRGCGGQLYNFGGIFTSPFYPMNVHNASVCRWHVTVPVNLKAVLSFQTFDLGPSTTCDSVFLELLEVDPVTNVETVRTRYCGGDSPAPFVSSTNMLVVRYTISVHNVGTGWVAAFVGKPPGTRMTDGMYTFDYDY